MTSECILGDVSSEEVSEVVTNNIETEYKKIIEKQGNVSHKYRIQHSYIDLRLHVMKLKLKPFLDSSNDLKIDRLPEF